MDTPMTCLCTTLEIDAMCFHLTMTILINPDEKSVVLLMLLQASSQGVLRFIFFDGCGKK